MQVVDKGQCYKSKIQNILIEQTDYSLATRAVQLVSSKGHVLVI